MSDEIIKEYANAELTVVWKPKACIHSKKCWKGLPEVFQPQNKPWVHITGASADDIRAQVAKCPSGALSIKGEEAAAPSTTVDVMPNGPLLVKGDIAVTGEGNKGPVTAFCRCGASTNKPYCDGSHSKVGFEG